MDGFATYERSLLTPGSRFDLWLAGDQTALSAQELAGYQLFKSYGCVSCHQGVNIGGNLFERQGIFHPLVLRKPELVRVPSLRNVAATAPYFHDGSAPTLQEAVRKMALAQLNRTMPEHDIAAISAFFKDADWQLQRSSRWRTPVKVKSAAVIVPLLVLLLFTWLSLRGMNPEAEEFDRALSALNGFVVAESALQRDVLAARSGLLRNYDPLVREARELADLVDQLKELTLADPTVASPVEALSASLTGQEQLTEQFKSDNALLQNSLAYFELFSNRLTASDRTGPVPPLVTTLSAAMLRLTLDTSPATAGEVEQQLDTLAAERVAANDDTMTRALLAHGRLLRKLLPQTDATLKALFALPIKQEQRAVRSIVLERQLASRNEARNFRLLLYAASVVLVGILIGFGLQLRARALALRRRAVFEHLIAGISTRFINFKAHELTAHIETALAELGSIWRGSRLPDCNRATVSNFQMATRRDQISSWLAEMR